MDYKEIVEKTKLKLDNENIQKGDFFHEMYSVWYYIIDKVDDKWLVLHRYSGNIYNYYLLTNFEIKTKFSYNSSGYWVDYCGNNIEKRFPIRINIKLLNYYLKNFFINLDVKLTII